MNERLGCTFFDTLRMAKKIFPNTHSKLNPYLSAYKCK